MLLNIVVPDTFNEDIHVVEWFQINIVVPDTVNDDNIVAFFSLFDIQSCELTSNNTDLSYYNSLYIYIYNKNIQTKWIYYGSNI